MWTHKPAADADRRELDEGEDVGCERLGEAIAAEKALRPRLKLNFTVVKVAEAQLHTNRSLSTG